jgi:hypothetical protein
MLDWMYEMTSADLSVLATAYAMRARETIDIGTCEAFGRLASQCTAMVAAREPKEPQLVWH